MIFSILDDGQSRKTQQFMIHCIQSNLGFEFTLVKKKRLATDVIRVKIKVCVLSSVFIPGDAADPSGRAV